jgi:hypothetical protein
MYSAPAQKFEPKLLAGSHLESQNFAGWLDGPFGIVDASKSRAPTDGMSALGFVITSARR